MERTAPRRPKGVARFDNLSIKSIAACQAALNRWVKTPDNALGTLHTPESSAWRLRRQSPIQTPSPQLMTGRTSRAHRARCLSALRTALSIDPAMSPHILPPLRTDRPPFYWCSPIRAKACAAPSTPFASAEQARARASWVLPVLVRS